MRPVAEVVDGVIYGLGAQNPKGHGACILMAAEALAESGVVPPVDLVFGFGAAGMPANRWWPDRSDGHGRGAGLLIEELGPLGAAVIAKTGWAVSHEEVGLTWFTVTVDGSHTYVGQSSPAAPGSALPQRHRRRRSAGGRSGGLVRDVGRISSLRARRAPGGGVGHRGRVAPRRGLHHRPLPVPRRSPIEPPHRWRRSGRRLSSRGRAPGPRQRHPARRGRCGARDRHSRHHHRPPTSHHRDLRGRLGGHGGPAPRTPRGAVGATDANILRPPTSRPPGSACPSCLRRAPIGRSTSSSV